MASEVGKKPKYTVLTFIFNNYEIVREIGEVDPDAEYLLITDDPAMKSETWKVIYDPTLDGMLPLDKAFTVRYSLFKYASSDVCVCIDGSIKIKKSFSHLIDDFISGGYDLGCVMHECRSNFPEEYHAWKVIRSYPEDKIEKFFKMLKNTNYDLNYQGLFTTGFRIWRRNKVCQDIDRMMKAFLLMLGDDGSYERLDQTVFTYVMHYYFNDVKLMPLSYQCLTSDFMQIHWHASEEPNLLMKYDLSKPDIRYVFNRPVVLRYLLPPGVEQPRLERPKRATYTLKEGFF